MSTGEGWLIGELKRRGVSRREFVLFCAGIAGTFALPGSAATKIAAALSKTKKPILVWLEFQDCCGNTESFLRAVRPTVAEIILDTLSLDYHETIMAAAGAQAEEALQNVVKTHKGEYLAVVEGSIPTGAGGAYCTIGGQSALVIAREVCGGAAATIAMGTCATYGGLPAAAPNPTGALGVADAVPGVKNLINLSACPANAENMTALLVYYLTFKRWPPLDGLRPAAVRLRSEHSRQLRATRALRRWAVRRGLGRRSTPHRLLPLQDGLQGPGHLPELPAHPLERRDELAHRLRPPVHRLRRAGLLGQDDAVLQAPARRGRLRRLRGHRHRRGVAARPGPPRPSPPTRREDGPAPAGDPREARHRRPRTPSPPSNQPPKTGECHDARRR